ncbi:MAG: J domain-containing protein [Campylobacterales bacterium]
MEYSGQYTLSFQNSTVNITIPKTSEDIDKIKRFVKNNFEEFYIGRNTVVIYQDFLADSRVLKCRKEFLEWLGRRSKLTLQEPSLHSFIVGHYKKTIKISFVAQNLSYTKITIKLDKIDETTLSMKVINDKSGFIYNYLKAKFILHSVYQDRDSQYIKMKYSNQKMLNELESIIQNKSLLGKSVFFMYKHEFISSLFKKSFSDKRNDTQTHSIKGKIVKLKDSYKLLELNYLIKDIGIIKKQYRELAKKYHPDRVYSQNPEIAREYQERFLNIKEAYETICEYIEKKSA